MKKISLLLALCVLAGVMLSGCSGTVASGTERWRRYEQIRDINTRQLVDDWDYFWLYERSPMTTPWHVWVGM